MIAQGLLFSDPSFLAYLAAFAVATLAPLGGAYRARSIPERMFDAGSWRCF